MKIHSSDYYLNIDFEAENARWGLLVIDDRWDVIKALIEGETSDLTGSKIEGLGEKCLNLQKLLDYWNTFYPSDEIYERTLLLLPWMVFNTKGISGVTLCNFPRSVEKLKAILQSHPDNYASSGWIFLIDIRDDSNGSEKLKESERFIETWELIDQLGCPIFVRARLTRGGMAVPDSVMSTPIIYKEPPQGGYPELKLKIQEWLLGIQGHISDTNFHHLTQHCCHNPSGIINTQAEIRQKICKKLSQDQHDQYGIWRWCSQEASLGLPPSTAAHRWLAGKAFQTSVIGSNFVPVTAMIAICEGVCYLEQRCNYSVQSPLYSIPSKNIDKLKALGSILLPEGKNYGEFAAALRYWLIIPEQFEKDMAYIVTISITNNINNKKTILSMTYSDELPEAIFSSTYTGRKGRVRRAWDELSAFSTRTSHNSNVVCIEFNWIE
ncbi:MAG: hypothetical protein NTY50_01130 [Methylobacter sp.]|nr:hypothetical protein [Methylobacter sp.]